MAAVRLARAFTKRNKIIKFAGCYHGHSDSLLVSAGSGALTYGAMDSNGITEGVSKDTIIFEYNDFENVKKYFSENKDDVACIIIEPIAANMGLILPEKEFLADLRKITYEYGSLLIFDEVISGFRTGLSGAQGYYRITPDLTVLGKIIGGGFPVGAFGGKKEIMDLLSPEGKVYHAGTLSGNPVSVAAGIATLDFLKSNPNIYGELEKKTGSLTDGIKNAAAKTGNKIIVNRLASLFTVFFSQSEIKSLKDAGKTDVKKFGRLFSNLLDNGIIIPPSQFEANFISLAHSQEDIEMTIDVIGRFFAEDHI
jgi:glutamate-1-semialdehyde 2,1-aminomutase